MISRSPRRRGEPELPHVPSGLPAQDPRKERLLQAAFDVIAERGFEGLRTREVARRAGVTVAMVHYYYRTKGTLIRELVRFIGEQFRSIHAPSVYMGNGSAPDLLRQEFADAKYYRKKYPRLATVYQEFRLHAQRDPSLRPELVYLEENRREDIRRIMKQGMSERSFRTDLDVELATDMIVSLLRGASYSTTTNFNYDGAYAEIAAWLGAA